MFLEGVHKVQFTFYSHRFLSLTIYYNYTSMTFETHHPHANNNLDLGTSIFSFSIFEIFVHCLLQDPIHGEFLQPMFLVGGCCEPVGVHAKLYGSQTVLRHRPFHF